MMTDDPTIRAAYRAVGPTQLPGLFTVEESARRVGNYRWVEIKLFEALGGWVATVPELDVKMVLGRHCYHHAWHAELWTKRLPELREMNVERMTAPANAELEKFIDAVREPEGPQLTIEKLVGVYRVLIPRRSRRTATTCTERVRSPTRPRSAASSSRCRTRSRTIAKARC